MIHKQGKTGILISKPDNANFDIGFIKKVAEDHGIIVKNPYLDTLALSRFLNPDLQKHKLDTLQEYFGLPEFNHHRAFEDAEVLGQIFDCMVKKMGQEGITNLDGMMNGMAAQGRRGKDCCRKRYKEG